MLLALCASVVCLVLLTPGTAQAHATGENYVWLNVASDHLEGRFEIGLAELRKNFGLSLPEDPDQARAEVAATANTVQQYLLEAFSVSTEDGELPLSFTGTDVVEAEGLGYFAQYFYRTAATTIPEQLTVRNEILFEKDRFHRSLLCIEYNRQTGEAFGEEFTALVFSASNSEQVLDLTNIEGLLRVRDFVWQGVLHIWIGIDHVLFLLALLLTSVLVWRPNGPESAVGATAGRGAWEPVASVKTALWTITKIVTTFTVAHSITLSLAALDIIRLPSRLVESIIALSIVLVAINNIFPKFREGHWILIFFFGLFHGMGFASVMGDLPFRMMHLVQIILAFNIGVELGQLAIVAAAFPVIYLLRKTAFYKPVILIGGSIAIGAMALYWFVERAFGLA